MLLHIPNFIYAQFNTALEIAVRKALYEKGDDKKTPTIDECWARFKADEELIKQLFRSADKKVFHFERKKKEELERNKEKIALQSELFCNALQLIFGFKLPPVQEGGDPEHYPYARRLNDWGRKFIAYYYPEHPEYYELMLPKRFRYETVINSTTQGPDLAATSKVLPDEEKMLAESELGNPRFKSLHGAYFITEYKQGEMDDYGVLQLTVRPPDIVTGKYTAYYRQKDGSYLERIKLKVRGHFLYETMLSLLYQNADINRKHAGVMLLNYNSSLELDGHFMPFHDPVLPERKGKIAWKVKLLKSTKAGTEAFLKRKLLERQKEKTKILRPKPMRNPK